MLLRIFVTLAILAGLAVAPNAQTPGPQPGSRAGVETPSTFRWEPGGRADAGDRVERALERARDHLTRQWERIERSWERSISRHEHMATQRADRIAAQVRARVRRQVSAQVRAQMRTNRSITRLGTWTPGMWETGAQTGTEADPCANSRDWDDDFRQHCEVRDHTLPAGPLNVDAGNNGGITVEGWDRNEVRVRAIVRANGRTDESARQLASGVQVQAGGGRVTATGPDTSRREWWSVSYRINVPRKNDLDLSASNGGITIAGVSGNLRFDTTNGGVRLSDLGGRVNGRTTNGGLTVNLGGNRWDGEGIDVETSNGGVTLAIPEGYSAELEARTVNGGLRVDFPITIQGELSGRKGISTTLGSGGPIVRVRTNNGGLKIGRR